MEVPFLGASLGLLAEKEAGKVICILVVLGQALLRAFRRSPLSHLSPFPASPPPLHSPLGDPVLPCDRRKLDAVQIEIWQLGSLQVPGREISAASWQSASPASSWGVGYAGSMAAGPVTSSPSKPMPCPDRAPGTGTQKAEARAAQSPVLPEATGSGHFGRGGSPLGLLKHPF